MSENITHTAVLDDCFRLMLASGAINDVFKQVGQRHWDFARLGCMTRSGDRFNPGLLASFRERWGARAPEDRLEPKLAFVLGWLCHRAADRQMKPVFRAVEPDRDYKPAECSIYHDAFLFHEVYAGGKESPYHPSIFDVSPSSLPAAAGVDVAALEALLRVLVQRALVALHTLVPGGDDVEGCEAWLDQLYDLRQDYTVDLARYAAAVADPDPEKVRRFITEVQFYDPQDPIIDVARSLQHGKAVKSEAVRYATDAEASSQYAQAVQRGYRYLEAASDFFDGKLDRAALEARLDIGKLGRDGKGV